MKTILYYFAAILIIICISTSVWSQDNKIISDTVAAPYHDDNKRKTGSRSAPISRGDPNSKKFDWKKVFIGGSLGLQFGTVTVIHLSPLIGYRFTEKITAGIGFTYQYYRYRTYYFTTSIYGGRVFARYIITDNLFAHVEYEVLNIETYDNLENRTNVESFLAGGGYRQKIGINSYFNLLVLWDFIRHPYSPYINPIIRAGVSIGF